MLTYPIKPNTHSDNEKHIPHPPKRGMMEYIPHGTRENQEREAASEASFASVKIRE